MTAPSRAGLAAPWPYGLTEPHPLVVFAPALVPAQRALVGALPMHTETPS